MEQKQFAVVVMAAGKGTRMKDPSKAKVMYEILGKPILHYVMDLAYDLGADLVVPVVGYMRDHVIAYLKSSHPSAVCAIQAEQLGTGHAVMQTAGALANFDGDVLVLSGDAPLLTRGTMEALIARHRTSGAVATVLTAVLDDATGYGRVIRNADGFVQRIVEHKDATDAERAVREINSGIYLFDKKILFEALAGITTKNAQNEYYLTDVFAYFAGKQLPVAAMSTPQPDEIRGINTVDQLKEAETLLVQRLQRS